MATRITRTSVVKAIGSPYLSLYRGNGYFYFVYDRRDAQNRLTYNTRSVMSCYMGSSERDRAYWIGEGRSFVADVEAGGV